MMRSERHISLAPPIVAVKEAAGRTFITSGSLSIEIPADMIPRIASELLVSMERTEDAASPTTEDYLRSTAEALGLSPDAAVAYLERIKGAQR